jgi:hypothetical protein
MNTLRRVIYIHSCITLLNRTIRSFEPLRPRDDHMYRRPPHASRAVVTLTLYFPQAQCYEFGFRSWKHISHHKNTKIDNKNERKYNKAQIHAFTNIHYIKTNT